MHKKKREVVGKHKMRARSGELVHEKEAGESAAGLCGSLADNRLIRPNVVLKGFGSLNKQNRR